jgi:hypothetical protein
VTGAEEGTVHVGTPPLIVRTCQLVPLVRPIVFPTRVRPLLNVKRSPKSPVLLLYEIPPVAVSEVRLILELNIVQSAPVRSHVELAVAFQIAIVTFGQTVEFAPLVIVIAVLVVEIDPNVRADCLELNIFQSVEESAPVVVLLASQIERPVPTRESPLAGVRIERAPCLLLNVVQSVPVSAPVVVALAFQIENTPVVLLYERGQSAEREVSPIFVATTHEREARFVFVSARLPERVFTVHERVAIFPVAVARLELMVTSWPVIVAILELVVARFVVSVAIFPVAVDKFVVNVAILPVALASPILRLFILTSWAVLLPWSFWNAWRTESEARTVPDHATNHVRRDERDIFPEKAL